MTQSPSLPGLPKHIQAHINALGITNLGLWIAEYAQSCCEAGSAAAAQAVPEGFVLVPREPTLEMLERGHHKIDFDRSNQNTEQMNHPSHFDAETGVGSSIETDMRDAWEAMLAAAPTQGAEGAAPQAVVWEASEREELIRLRTLVHSPELRDFARGAVLEASHQRERWGSEHDAGKTPADWFWLIGYLGGKALAAHTGGDVEKALHHTISTAAACANWHAAISGSSNTMRPGIDPAAHGIAASPAGAEGAEA